MSINRKIKEAILAFRIERALSKERILELYLNQIYLGSGAYGIAAASLEYFDKSIRDINYSEAALLAALPKAPSRYNPYRDIEVAKFRRNLVLKNLLDNNYITSEWYEKLKNKEIILSKNKKIYLQSQFLLRIYLFFLLLLMTNQLTFLNKTFLNLYSNYYYKSC